MLDFSSSRSEVEVVARIGVVVRIVVCCPKQVMMVKDRRCVSRSQKDVVVYRKWLRQVWCREEKVI
jgi:hypothetical protein